MQDEVTVELINKQLKLYGSNIYDNPIFRVVFSENQVENRRGTFKDFSGDIFIREVTEIREVKKYPWIKEKWILERWAPGSISHHPDLISMQDGVYICVYAFQDKNCNYLPPLLKVCEVLISNLLNPKRGSEILSRDQGIEEKMDKLEVDVIEEELIVQSDEMATKDPKSSRESISSGYTKILIEK